MTALYNLRLRPWRVYCAILLCGGCDFLADSAQENGMVFSGGSYVSPSGRYILRVPAQGGVEYTITDAATGDVALEYDANASRYQRWFLCWGPDDRLWHYSSDDGEFHVWAIDRAGRWHKHVVVDLAEDRHFVFDDALIQTMPLPVFRHLPSSSKDRWGFVIEQDEHGSKTVRRIPLSPRPRW